MTPKPLLLPLLAGAFCAPWYAQTAHAQIAHAQTAHAQTAPSASGGIQFSGHLRSRIENYDFFETATSGDAGKYTFTGHQLRLSGLKSTSKWDVQLDLQQQLLTGVPDDASFQPLDAGGVPVGGRVPLGQGGNYYAANGGRDGALNIKQAFARYKGLAGQGSSLRLGRFEFNDGLEVPNANPTLNWLKTQRLSQRLVGTFGYTHTGRAFDGAQLSLPLGASNLTAVAVRPTEGVFQMNANDNVDAVNFLYAAYTRPAKSSNLRVFGLAYEDGREASKSVKTDNRPLAARQADNDEIQLFTLGADYARTLQKFDVLAWGALQTGDWGNQDHSAYALALEAGYQPRLKWRPWLRAGYYLGSGDGNAADSKHKTFFTPLPTPRLYARFPFYNQMNSEDLYAQMILRPTPKLNVRGEVHALKLANSNDLFYVGGGAFQDNGFGMAGRPSGGRSKLANLVDVSLDYTINPKSSVGLYLGYAAGKGVIENSFAGKKHATLAFLEFTRKF